MDIFTSVKLGMLMTLQYKRVLFFFIFLFAVSARSLAQRYNFEQYDIENGLTQSQITSITQDHKRRLWITTLGGLSCFNGNQFNNYSKTSGLSSNFMLAIASDKRNNIYIGSAKGLSRYDGQHFYNYHSEGEWVNKLVADRNGNIYILRGKKLYKTTDGKEQAINISGDAGEAVTALKSGQSGKVWAAVYGKGLFRLDERGWQIRSNDEKLLKLIVTDLIEDDQQKNRVWLLTTTGIYTVQNGLTEKYRFQIPSELNVIEQDEKGAIWIGTNNGAYYVTAAGVLHFNSRNGFTDNVVNEIFKDAEHNIWLGTNGSGLFRFTGNGYVTFDESQGVDRRIVMSMAKGPEPGSIWLGSYGGLYEFKQNRPIKKIQIPSAGEEAYRINFLYKDSKENIWIGTPGGGLWVRDAKGIRRTDELNGRNAYNAIIESTDGTIWLATSRGCFTYDPKKRKFSQITRSFGGSLLELNRDSILYGTPNGTFLITGKKKVTDLNVKALNGSSVLCMLRDRDNILFGTSDYGIIIWNRKSGSTNRLTTAEGLAADQIYSMLKDSTGTIWAGTGKGINRLSPDNYHILQISAEDAPLVECNQNAILQHGSNIWIGTTRGAMVFGLNSRKEKKVAPYIYINSVSILPNARGLNNSGAFRIISKEQDLAKTIALPYNHNHLNITFTGIHLSSPGDLQYQYRLLGLDDKYSQPGSISSVSFTAIPPGKYTFQVKAMTRDGQASGNIASFSFEVAPPYYQTGIFRVIILLFIVLIILLTVRIILSLNERKRKLRLRIKLEEQFKIRKQTAEDFHDDLGNKLTRINVLTEVLGSMIDQNDHEKRNILQKISTNVNELYTGTKDILWSLNPKNDTLIQLLNHIRDFGTDLFNDTPIKFEHDLLLSNDSKLSLDISRNILMILKEAMHNILKHSKATQVRYEAKLTGEKLMIKLDDNGHGFDTEHGKNGHGVNNMYLRAKRIKSDLKIKSKNSGTSICLIINFSTLAHFKNA